MAETNPAVKKSSDKPKVNPQLEALKEREKSLEAKKKRILSFPEDRREEAAERVEKSLEGVRRKISMVKKEA